MTHWYIGTDGYPHYNETAHVQEFEERAKRAEAKLDSIRTILFNIARVHARDTHDWQELFRLFFDIDLSMTILPPGPVRADYFPGDREIAGLQARIRYLESQVASLEQQTDKGADS